MLTEGVGPNELLNSKSLVSLLRTIAIPMGRMDEHERYG
jgi:hypothetical protein